MKLYFIIKDRTMCDCTECICDCDLSPSQQGYEHRFCLSQLQASRNNDREQQKYSTYTVEIFRKQRTAQRFVYFPLFLRLPMVFVCKGWWSEFQCVTTYERFLVNEHKMLCLLKCTLTDIYMSNLPFSCLIYSMVWMCMYVLVFSYS